MKNLKEITKMDYAKRMDRVLEHIQDHLDDELSLEILADIACFSQFHFHRIFSGMIGEPVKSYIRRLRLERAAKKLAHTDAPVTTIAFESGFETHESFTRSFRKAFGISPLHYRKTNQIEIRKKRRHYWKEITMKAEIVTLEDMDVIFVRHVGPYNMCGAAWEILFQWAGPKGLLQPGTKIMGLSFDDPQVTPPEKLRYDACIEIKRQIKTEKPVGQRHVTGGRFAKTTHMGPYDSLAETYAQLCGQWIPQNGYEIINRECIEIYLNSPENTEPQELITDIYIPVK
ncbi:AraC family transcriptional regulator [Desulfogranum japonicum]|uniref:AraC family transcriptional regulator n=1 Tax=Desulfogranum japonicum TaxID=231447 RepID=UPI000428E65F|nr:AraC family transcriptional regulator [Desulfogranum japonicum]